MRSGLAAEFASAEELMHALRELRARGYRQLDAFTPHPVEGLDELLRLGRSRINFAIFPVGIGGAAFAFWLQWYCNAYSYAINVGGRPPYGWPAMIPITFETGVLATAVSAFIVLFWTIGLPNLTHPLFNVDGFERASVDRYWLAIDERDGELDRARTTDELEKLRAMQVQPFGGYAEQAS